MNPFHELRENRLFCAHFRILAQFVQRKNAKPTRNRSHRQNEESPLFSIGFNNCRLAQPDDSDSKYGQLTYENWRAIRLVVDTGIHSLGWTRQQAIDYFLANSSKSEHEVTVEIDRYIVWPGQALAYKIGQMKIRELRNYATRELGDKFDVRQFHDQILGGGALPLDVLEARIKNWVQAQKSAKP